MSGQAYPCPAAKATVALPGRPRTADDRLQAFDGRLRAELDALARWGTGGRSPRAPLARFRTRLVQLHADDTTAERALAELARRCGVVCPPEAMDGRGAA